MLFTEIQLEIGLGSSKTLKEWSKMSTQDNVVEDIFAGAEKVEVLGRLPTYLWGYILEGRKLVGSLDQNPESCGDSVSSMEKYLGVLESAAKHLGNQELKDHLEKHTRMVGDLGKGTLSPTDFIASFNAELSALERMAGPKPDAAENGEFRKRLSELAASQDAGVKKGRSADIIVSVELLNDIRDYLSTEVMTEGVSSVLVIDNAGTLIVNIGDKIDLDVVSLAAVAAANFAATEKIARLIGESDFVLLFYKGHNESFHFMRIGKEYIIVTIFDNSLSLGLLRLKISEVAQELEKKLPKREV